MVVMAVVVVMAGRRVGVMPPRGDDLLVIVVFGLGLA
jgi:hypothetical protein